VFSVVNAVLLRPLPITNAGCRGLIRGNKAPGSSTGMAATIWSPERTGTGDPGSGASAKIVKLKGDFVWHDHDDTDETFIILDGALRIDFRDGHVNLTAGEMYVVPKGVEHKPYAENEAKVLLIEPRGVRNTGHEASERTAENDVWV
jgi:mannose-6-phosphate isomerase-like protein (cupin superfamily)